ncbi:hypothetical protein C1646_752999 [Rhizophagus diaphanus]|nr:hypothetical protein C1646_752999 [Rhizophagus diaphanus] [Rhizophagus sp. MUCL 43196]
MDSHPVLIHPETLRKHKIRENETHNQRERRYARDVYKSLHSWAIGQFDVLDIKIPEVSLTDTAVLRRDSLV